MSGSQTRRLLVPIAIFITTVLPVFLIAQPAERGDAVVDLAVETASLIRSLDSSDRTTRITAEKSLLDLGPGVLDHLPSPDLLKSASARAGVRRVRKQLERTEAIRSAKASRVSLSTTAPLVELLQEIERQTGNRIDVSGVPVEIRSRTLPADYDDVSFWDAVDDLRRRARLKIDRDAGGDRLVLVPESTPNTEPAPSTTSGPFRILVESASTRPLAGDPQRLLVRTRLHILAEPRLRPLFLRYGGGDVNAHAAAGRALPAFNPDASYELPLGEGGRRILMQTEFTAAADDPPETLRLAGRLSMQTAAGSERIVFRDLSKIQNVSKRRGGVTVRVLEVNQTSAARESDAEGERGVRIRIAVGYDRGGPAFESHRTWIYHNRVYLEDAQGRRRMHDGRFQTVLQSNGTVAVEYSFKDVGADLAKYNFVYVAPTLIIDVPVKFEIDRVPIVVSPGL